MTSRNKRINNSESGKVWFWSLVCMACLALFIYGYMVRGTIVNIVARQNIETELSILSSKVTDLESAYIKAKNGVTEELAYSMGFIPVTNQKFVSRGARTSSLSLITPGL